MVQKSKRVKKELKELNKRGFNDVQVADTRAYHAMIEAKNMMHQNLGRIDYADAELTAIKDQYHLKLIIYI